MCSTDVAATARDMSFFPRGHRGSRFHVRVVLSCVCHIVVCAVHLVFFLSVCMQVCSSVYFLFNPDFNVPDEVVMLHNISSILSPGQPHQGTIVGRVVITIITDSWPSRHISPMEKPERYTRNVTTQIQRGCYSEPALPLHFMTEMVMSSQSCRGHSVHTLLHC